MPRVVAPLTDVPESVLRWVMFAIPAAFTVAGTWLTLKILDVILF